MDVVVVVRKMQTRLSALGQKQTFAVQKSVSALLPKADMCGALIHVRFVPIADISFAVFKLTTRSNLVACSTPRSPALALFNIRFTMHRGVYGPALELLNANRLLGTRISSRWRAGNCNYDLGGSRT